MESNLNRIRAEAGAQLEGQATQHDSMVTVRLSEPPILTLDTKRHSDKIITNEELDTNEEINTPTDRRQTIMSIMDVTRKETGSETRTQEDSPRITMVDPNGNEVPTPTGSESAESERNGSRRGSDSSDTSVEEVNWEELEKTEEQQPRNQDSDDGTALLLARLEQENNAIASNPKSGIAKVQKVEKQRARAQSRPPSIQHLKKLVNGPTPSALRYSVTPPPPMTDLEFYAALVQDYPRTAQYLPTLLSKKIRSGIPPPLRGVVWQSMSGARDRLLEEQFDRLCGESSPYEGIIGKDLGRSFPGVEMFRDPEGDGQRMLGRVLKCFSLYDHKIGYCQGLGFLVGPLLMHMGDKQAFCVLVRLMEHYDLRNCFLPDLAGLHVRIHQFRELLKLHLPALSAHLDVLQVEPAYVSQWFLSFFATTCPLPMLFRIYDVIFAEGASETIMRVALSLMRKNETKILSCTEFEDVMQLLLSRGLWDVYHYNADEFVNDFVSLTGIVTHESLQNLEAGYRESQIVDTAIPSDVGSAASRFLGRLWAGSNSSTRSANLTPSPGLSAPSRPVSFLRRSPSKQSLASTLYSMEGGSGSESMLSTSTDATSVSRESANPDNASMRVQSFASVSASKTPVNKDRNLHSQIEDLLMALSEMQRDHAILATELQREREEREEDRNAVQPLIRALRKGAAAGTVEGSESDFSDETVKMGVITEEVNPNEVTEAETGNLTVSDVVGGSGMEGVPTSSINTEDLSCLLDIVEDRFQNPIENRGSSMLLTRSQLRDELSRSKEQLVIETSKSQEFIRRIAEQDQEISNLRDQIRETQAHVRNSHQDRQRLEKQVFDLRNSRKSAHSPLGDHDVEWGAKSSTTGGLRELKLVRSNSQRSVATTYNKRSSSLISHPPNFKENENPRASTFFEQQHSSKQEVDSDSLVLELVQAKTAEAIAKQEAEEAKLKLESLKKMLAGLQNCEVPPTVFGHKSNPSLDKPVPSKTWRNTMMKVETPSAPTSAPAAAAPTSGGGFWGWGKKSAASTEGK